MTKARELETVLERILNCNKLYLAKELAAEALDVDVDDYLVPASDDDEGLVFEMYEDDEMVDTLSDIRFS